MSDAYANPPPVFVLSGTILPPCCPTVMIGGLPAARMGDFVSPPPAPPLPPPTILKGSMTVKIGGKPAARVGDPTSNGSMIKMGCMTVMIGG
jgi:uncharacterized Zn-binding protein involved in type VI secretion